MVAEFGAAGPSLYEASKAALALLMKSWAAEYGPHGIRVNAVSPGPTRTEGTAGMGDALDQLTAAAPARRPGTAEEMAEAIAFLATDRASFVHSAVLPVDGGRIAVSVPSGLARKRPDRPPVAELPLSWANERAEHREVRWSRA
jgi:NAD(P)-dependent dehydrogenase (short-subunit alcohol dehydrogenase family)